MTDDNSDENQIYPTESSVQKRKRNTAFLTDSEVNNTPQVRGNKSGMLPLKSVFSRVLADVTNTRQSSPTTPQSEVLNHPLSGLNSITESSVKPRRNTNQASKRLKPNLNTCGLTGQSSQCDSSIRQSNFSSKRTGSDIQPTNLFKAFSTLEKTDNVNGMEFGAINLDLFEDQGSQVYDISSEEEDTIYDNNSESETECAPQQDQNVSTVPDEQRERIKTMASVFQTMFQDKPAKKGWSVSKRTVSKSKKKAAPPKQNMGNTSLFNQ
ncbi:hypothetical protein Bca4012_052814 [Brassica carinata]|uniref:Uncharacterized protein n=1 Tax=Brassica napus TaxID=3708 RepID=A0ABQ8B6Z0_BRANA|nr:hypothetical protein HID58_049578 [Brassica napus]